MYQFVNTNKYTHLGIKSVISDVFDFKKAAIRGEMPLDAIMIGCCQGDDTFVAFQPMGIFHFLRNGKFTFF